MGDNWYKHLAREKGLIRFWTRYKSLSYHMEIAVKKHVAPGFSFSFGNRGSETPVDVHFSVGPLAIFYDFNFPGLGKFCEVIGQGHKREISLKVHSKAVWWKLWYNDDMGYDSYHNCDPWRRPKLWPWSMGRHKYRSWMCLRDGNLDLNPVDAFYGKKYYDYHTVGTVTALVPVNQFPNDEYNVEFKLQKVTSGRKYGPDWARRREDNGWTVAWRCDSGIPVRNHDWKGDDILASGEGVDLSDPYNDWVAQAVISLVERIKKDREHYNYRPDLKETANG